MAHGAAAIATLGDVNRATEYMEHVLLVDPDNPKMGYNFAYSVTAPWGVIDAAFELLGPEFDKMASGSLNRAEADADLYPLRQDPRFKSMVTADRAGHHVNPASAVAPA